MIISIVNLKNNQPSSVKEYQFAKQQGYKGSYEDFLNSKKATTNINTGISGFQKSAVDAITMFRQFQRRKSY